MNLDELEKLAKEATPGPWLNEYNGIVRVPDGRWLVNSPRLEYKIADKLPLFDEKQNESEAPAQQLLETVGN